MYTTALNNNYIDELSQFSKEIGAKLILNGTVGLFRECVGLVRNNQFIDVNPVYFDTENYVSECFDLNLFPPKEVSSYHKYSCFCVLVKNNEYDKAVLDLFSWYRNILEFGQLELHEYETKANKLQRLLTGEKGYALKYKNKNRGVYYVWNARIR